MLTDYITYAEVRAVLGVSSTELPDTVLAQPQWLTLLQVALDDLSENFAPTYATISALPSVSRSAKEQRFYDLLRLYSSFVIAKSLLASLPMFSVLSLTDGRAEFRRQSNTFQDVRDGVDAGYSAVKERLVNVYAGLGLGGSVYSSIAQIFSVSSELGVDPVTNA